MKFADLYRYQKILIMLTSLCICSFVSAFLIYLFHKMAWPIIQQYYTTKIILKKGIETEALILQSEKKALYKQNFRQLNIQLLVQRFNGRDFVAETKEILYFTDMHIVAPGKRLRVKYNPANLKQVMILKN